MRGALALAFACLLPFAAAAEDNPYLGSYSTIPPNTALANSNLWADNPVPVALSMDAVRSAVAANDTTTTAVSIPANAVLRAIYINNTTANAVTGGVDIGTTAGGADIIAAQAVAANAKVVINPGALLVQWFSTSAAQQIFVTAHTAWNSASLNVRFVYDQ